MSNYEFYKNKVTDNVYWVDNLETKGEFLF